jgi:hypothetical protein
MFLSYSQLFDLIDLKEQHDDLLIKIQKQDHIFKEY